MSEFVEFLNGKDNLYVEWELKSSPQELYPQERLEEYVEKVYAAARSVRTRNSQFVFTSGDYRGLRYLQEHHPDAEERIVLWDYRGSTPDFTGIPTNRTRYRLNFWHTDNWPVDTTPRSKEAPLYPYEVEIDWMSYKPM